MSDLSAGTLIQALDYPAARMDINTSAIGNNSNTTYSSDTSCSTTFIAPTTGRVCVSIGGELRDNASTNYVRLSAEVTDARDGTTVVGPDAYARGVASIKGALDYETCNSVFMLEGLIPGNEYVITLNYRVSGGTSADLDTTSITVWPAT